MVVSVYPLPRGGPISPVKHLPRLLSSGDIRLPSFILLTFRRCHHQSMCSYYFLLQALFTFIGW